MFYRRTLRFMLPLACLVAFSRVYNGVHYPSDVLGGAIIGAGYGVAIAFALEVLWRRVGRALFPTWWQTLPSLLRAKTYPREHSLTLSDTLAAQWLRLGHIVLT